MNVSAYKVLLDERDVRVPDAAQMRRQKTKNLLSGGFAKPSLADQIQQPFPDYAPQPNNNYAPQQQFAPNPQYTPSFNPAGLFNSPFQPSQPQGFQSPPSFQPTNPFQSPGFQNLQPSNPFQSSAFQGLQPTNPFQSRFSKPTSFLNQPNWRPSSRKFSRRFSTRSSRSSRSSRGSKGSRSSRRPRNRYDISDDDSDSEEELTSGQKKKVMKLVAEMCPSGMTSAIQQNILDQMDKYEKQGYRLPKNYDKSKHDLNANEMQLFGQQVEKAKSRNRNKAENLISFAARAIHWGCKFMHIDIINTDGLPEAINKSLKEGEFEDDLEEVGTYLQGTIFDHPVVATANRFLNKIGASSDEKVNEENEKLEDELEKREERSRKVPLSNLNNFKADPTCFGLPKPSEKKHSPKIEEIPKPAPKKPDPPKKEPVVETVNAVQEPATKKK